MKIEIWSDYACPFCYVGKRHLENALSQFAQKDDVQIVHKAFELDPTVSREVNTTTQQRIERKYGRTPAGAMEFIRHVERAGKNAGLDMRYETVQYSNTFDAHRLTKLAETLGKANEMNERLMKAYFTDNLSLAEKDVLIKCAEDVGIARELVTKMLNSDEFANLAREDEKTAQQIGVQSVPFMLIDGKYAISGAQPAQMMLHTLQKAWDENPDNQLVVGASCGVDGCH